MTKRTTLKQSIESLEETCKRLAPVDMMREWRLRMRRRHSRPELPTVSRRWPAPLPIDVPFARR